MILEGSTMETDMFDTVDRAWVVPTPMEDTPDSFAMELRSISDNVVQKNLSQFLAYSLKEQDALDILANPDADKPLLAAEAKLRGIPVDKLAKKVQKKAGEMKDVVSRLELLRVEFATRYPDAPNKLALRDELLAKANAVVEGL
jgi:hypothetical protein